MLPRRTLTFVLLAHLLVPAGCSDDEASTAAAAGGAGGGAPDDLAGLSDDFEGAGVDPEWALVNGDAVAATVAGGALSLTLTEPALWFEASQGVLLHKAVTGDFRVTARVRARKTSAPDEPPDRTIHLGGLMARDPASDGAEAPESYVFIVVGRDENDVSVETKSTMNDESDYDGPTWPSTDAELRLCRVGSTFRAYKREGSAAAWEEAVVYERPDLPATLQVGPNIYALTAPDLTVHFDEVTFARVATASDCTR